MVLVIQLFRGIAHVGHGAQQWNRHHAPGFKDPRLKLVTTLIHTHRAVIFVQRKANTNWSASSASATRGRGSTPSSLERNPSKHHHDDGSSQPQRLNERFVTQEVQNQQMSRDCSSQQSDTPLPVQVFQFHGESNSQLLAIVNVVCSLTLRHSQSIRGFSALCNAFAPFAVKGFSRALCGLSPRSQRFKILFLRLSQLVIKRVLFFAFFFAFSAAFAVRGFSLRKKANFPASA